MDKRDIQMLAEVLDTYFDPEEFSKIASIWDVNLRVLSQSSWMAAARQLVERLEHGNHRAMLGQVLEQAEVRNARAIANTDWERRDFHQTLAPYIRRLQEQMGDAAVPSELAVSENKPFGAKSEVRGFLEKAETPVLVVDPYVGVGTLDCFRTLKVPIRLLTALHPNSVEQGFERQLQTFQDEGFQIEVRRTSKLHDRHIAFNERCWLVGSSLKDAGNKAFHVMEIKDAKNEVVNALEAKWESGTPYPPHAAAAAVAENE